MSVQSQIETLLTQHFAPMHMDVINESAHHNVPAGSEMHFKVILVTEKFHNQSLVQRHRQIHEILRELMQQQIHALSLKTFTPEEWEARGKTTADSPNCRGGFGQ